MIHYRRPLRLRRSINRLRPYPADDTAAMATYDAHLLALDAVQAAQRAMDDYQFRFTRTLATEARTVSLCERWKGGIRKSRQVLATTEKRDTSWFGKRLPKRDYRQRG